MKSKEPKILKKLEEIEAKEEKGIKKFMSSPKFKVALVFVVLIIFCALILYLVIAGGRVYVDKADIEAPIIFLSPSTPGILDRVLVREGDIVSENMIVAVVSGNPIRAKTSGLVISITNTPGASVSSQTPIVKMIDPSELRVLGKLEEDKGLNKVKEGQRVIFTVDAFGSKQYKGTVETISPTSHQSDIVFSISDKRELKDFDIKVRFDINSYPELRNGMSARMWIYQ